MNVLLAMPMGETLNRLIELIPANVPRRAACDQHALVQSLEQPFDRIVLHAGLFANAYPWEWMLPLKEKQPQAKMIIFLDEAVYDSLWQEVLERLAAELGFTVYPSGLSVNETVSLALRAMFGPAEDPAPLPPAKGKAVAVWSAACKDGATTVAVNAAISLAKYTPLRVGLLDLNFKNPELRLALGLPDAGRAAMMLRAKLQTGALRQQELLDAMTTLRKMPNLHVLPGTFRRDTAADWMPEMIDDLLSVCRSAFDVTILDVSSYPDNAATICAVRQADVRWLVTRNHSSSYLWNWGEWYESGWKHYGVEPEQISLVVNRYAKSGESPAKAAAQLRMELAAVIPEGKGEPLADTAAIRQLASRLSIAAGGEPLPEAPASRRFGWKELLARFGRGERRVADVIHEA